MKQSEIQALLETPKAELLLTLLSAKIDKRFNDLEGKVESLLLAENSRIVSAKEIENMLSPSVNKRTVYHWFANGLVNIGPPGKRITTIALLKEFLSEKRYKYTVERLYKDSDNQVVHNGGRR